MFTRSDFDLFNEPTLAGRMHLIKTVVDPKFEALAPEIIASLQVTGQPPFYAHVAQHRRRYKNPPVDTWVAFSQNKRGYKGWPHFELGLWPDRLFIYFDLLDEAKPIALAQLTPAALAEILAPLPADMVITANHGAATTKPATKANVARVLATFTQKKHSELVVGRSVGLDDPLFEQPAALRALILKTFTELMPIYRPVMAAFSLAAEE
ncbi:DUF1054 family protein [Lactiplantibacillus modestisalitolerans]|uniref:UPF0637 protein ACFFLI_10005 n=1 Tax=Lactiplantibacillus modestisalitolerans TaxID=1457219 RepID=A0ABV5WVK6_9LACO|nr:DUF1054 family protein [Lactiplantibacillus modestisalitolerans]